MEIEDINKFLLGLVITTGLTALAFILGIAGYHLTLGLLNLLGIVSLGVFIMAFTLTFLVAAAIFGFGVLIHNVGDYFEHKMAERHSEE